MRIFVIKNRKINTKIKKWAKQNIGPTFKFVCSNGPQYKKFALKKRKKFKTWRKYLCSIGLLCRGSEVKKWSRKSAERKLREIYRMWFKVKESPPGVRELGKMGYNGLIGAIMKRFGGFTYFAQSLGLPTKQKERIILCNKYLDPIHIKLSEKNL